MLACAAVLVLAASPFAYAQAVDLADARSDMSGGAAPEALEYESSGLDVTGAELLDFPFLSISIEFTDDAGDRALTIFFADPLFDPVFDPDGYQLDVITDVGPHDSFETLGRNIPTNNNITIYFIKLHDSFETLGRNMTITNLPVGIESIDIYLSARDASGDAAPDGDSSTAQDPDLDASGDETAGDDAPDQVPDAPDQVPDAPEPVAGGEQSAPEDVTGDFTGDNGGDDSGMAGGMPSEAGEPPDGADAPGGVTPQPSEYGPASGEPSTVCGPGTVLVGGVCMLEEPPGSGTEQEAESDAAPVPQSGGGGGDARADSRGLAFGAAGGFLAAGIIAVILALIYRAGRRKH